LVYLPISFKLESENAIGGKIKEEKGKAGESKENFDSLAGDYLNSEIGRY